MILSNMYDVRLIIGDEHSIYLTLQQAKALGEKLVSLGTLPATLIHEGETNVSIATSSETKKLRRLVLVNV